MKRWLVAILVSASFQASQAQAQPVLYGLTSEKDSTLYTIDPSTGTATLVGATGFSGCSSLEASDTGILYAVCDNDSQGMSLVTIDRATGAGTEIGDLLLDDARAISDIAFAADGTLFGYARAIEGADFLVTIDLTSGEATEVGSNDLSGGGHGISFAGGVLYHEASTDFSSIDTTTGADTFLCAPGQPDPQEELRANAMDTHPETSVLFASLQSGGEGSGDYFLGTVSLCENDEAALTVIGPTVDRLDAIAWFVLPDLSISKADSPDPVTAGGQLTYTITVENLGLAAAPNVVVTDTLPAGTTFVSSTGCVESPGGGVPTCTIASVPGSGSAVVTLVVSVSAAAVGPLVNTATIGPSQANQDPANDSATAETGVVPLAADPIPTLSELGLAALVLLLIATGVMFVRRA